MFYVLCFYKSLQLCNLEFIKYSFIKLKIIKKKVHTVKSSVSMILLYTLFYFYKSCQSIMIAIMLADFAIKP